MKRAIGLGCAAAIAIGCSSKNDDTTSKVAPHILRAPADASLSVDEPPPIQRKYPTLCNPVQLKPSAWGLTVDASMMEIAQRWLTKSLTDACTEQNWADNTIRCFENATAPAQLDACWRLFANGDAMKTTTKKIVERANGWAKSSPLECAEVVARFYSPDELAKVQMPRFTAAERKQAFAEAQQALLEDCTSWPVAARICFADATDRADQLICLADPDPWEELPLATSLIPTKVKACDRYIALYKKCADSSSAQTLSWQRLALFHAEPGSVQEREAIERCQMIVEDMQGADPCAK